jgi:predicted nucleic acid-binding protein
MKIAVDTNVLVYAHDTRYPAKQAACVSVLIAIEAHAGRAVSLQVMGEFFSISTKKLSMKPAIAEQLCQDMIVNFPVYGFGQSNVSSALKLARAGVLSYWDGLLLSASLDAGCDIIVSEDMHSGFKYGTLEVISPFDAKGALSAKLMQRINTP